jgi:hypothetical protein
VKTLFKPETETYTDEANSLADEVRSAVLPIIRRWTKEGYSTRDIEAVVVMEIQLECSTRRLEIQASHYRAKHQPGRKR